MAKCQCPNCGGYKTYRAMDSIYNAASVLGFILLALTPVFGVASLAFGLIMLGIAFPLSFTPFALPFFRDTICEICGNRWRPNQTAPPVAARTSLLEMGNALLERQAAAAAEEERRQEEQRRWYGERAY